MKRSITLLLALALLTGCADSTTSQQEPNSQPTTSVTETTELTTTKTTTAATSAPAPSTAEAPEERSFIGQDGETLYLKDSYKNVGDDYFFSHAYGKYPDPMYYTTEGNGDSIGEGGDNWYVIKEGDTFGGLTVTSADCTYAVINGEGDLFTQHIYLDGTVTLSGTLVHNDEIELGLGHELFFLPYVDSFKDSGLPVTQESKSIPRVDGTRITAVEVSVFGLGEGERVRDILDKINFDERGTAEVTLTLDSICLSFCFGRKSGTGFNFADVASVEQIIEPDVSLDQSRWKIEYETDADDIEAQLGYDTPVDVTKLEYFDSALHWAEQLEGEDREQFIADNYSYIYLSSSFIGSEKADWLYIANYYLCLDGPNHEAYYSKVFYVKDGIITETIAEFYGACSNGSIYSGICRRGDSLILSVYGDGIYSLDTNTDELTKLCGSEGWWCKIDEMTEDYILFADGDNRTKVYYFDSGEVFTTEKYSGFMDGISFYRDGDTLVFAINWADLREKYSGAQYLSLNLKTREYTPLDYEGNLSDLEPKKPAAENVGYSVENDGLEIFVTDKTDGSVKRYSLQELWTEYLAEQGSGVIYRLKLYEDTLFGFIDRSRIFALDLQNNEICVADANGYFNSYSCELLPDGRIAMSSSGTCAVYGLA